MQGRCDLEKEKGLDWDRKGRGEEERERGGCGAPAALVVFGRRRSNS